MKRSAEDDGAPAKRAAGKGGKDGGKRKGGAKGGGGKEGGGRSGLGELRAYAFKVLCSDPVAANVIGHQGATRQEIEEETGCNVWLSKRDSVFPRTQCRLIILHADTPAQVLAALKRMTKQLVEVAEKDRDQNTDVETPLLGKEADEYIFRAALPSFIRGKLIGTKGANIKQLREETGARIFVENEMYDGHQFTRVIGPPHIIDIALERLNTLIQEEADTDDFRHWAAVNWFDPQMVPITAQDRMQGHSEHDSYSRDTARPRRDRRSPSRGRGGPPPGNGGYPEPRPAVAAVEELGQLTRDFPTGALDLNHAVSCDLPSNCVGALIGTKGEYVRHVERSTNTQISFSSTPGDNSGHDEYRTLTITGALYWVYTAHAMIMKRYHEKEAQNWQREAESNAQDKVEDLQAKINKLQSELAAVSRSAGVVTDGRQSKGKGRR